jgi:hypothetical protein
MDWTRLKPYWLRAVVFFFFAKEVTTGEWVKGILSQALTYIQAAVVWAFRYVGNFALGSTSLLICMGMVAIIAGSALFTLYLIRGRHRTLESNVQNTTTTTSFTSITPTNIISIQSAMQHGSGPHLQSYCSHGKPIETFMNGMNLEVWWNKLKIQRYVTSFVT